ncbi:MAG: phosphopantetheine adenylyltransferase [Chloroflexi bacterium AL-W]|nr:phosphopantetheine adenylyltransferase [Chloroflexi bacterium AL-N1]NOK67161.1 phosphopantetheine adenylyltransferase [Chloroflexi bacterium AL-N10]NOK75345.1 phosphopantetheine adenylyltransferase [Chloroflexi bacterium AL-N5]NOK82133.1 phosphopantetheine adenylyltransferase [Chloroflexi bacterium AL-W]NOK89978.1 phosphopantetheine adenylyltransferase [Chloroflexi bacterium AL-N15]
MERLISALFIIVGLINLYPIIGVFGSGTLTNLYGLPFQESNLLILMRHRAILLGLIGVFLIAAAVQHDWQTPALIGGLISMLTFVVIAFLEGGFNLRITIVVIADVIVSVLLGVAGVLRM